MKEITINTQQSNYKINVGKNILKNINKYVAIGVKNIVIVTDENVDKLYGNVVEKALANYNVFKIVVAPGEQSKSNENLQMIYNKFCQFNITRGDLVIALGGGVVGDLCGYACATFMRGIDFLGVPTTLLAQIDSSVGGKVAINHSCGKNLIGAFYQPVGILTDVATLNTLDSRQMACGYGEMIKYAVLDDTEFFDEMLNSEFNHLKLQEYIVKCCKIKEKLVAQDTFDKGVRMLLNFGHTFGHGVENACGYGTVLHGEAVAIGMVLACKLGEAYSITNKNTSQKLIEICKKFGLPYSIENMDKQKIAQGIIHDKKSSDNTVNFVFIDKKIGQCVLKKIKTKDLQDFILSC